MNKQHVLLEQLKGQLIVSCQALEHEPLHSSYIMSKMAYAAMLGGAKGIRANSVEDIVEIKKVVQLPIIGIIKKVHDNSDVFITPSLKEIDELVAIGVEIIAIDATNRKRPDGQTIAALFPTVREKYPTQLFMADCSTYEEGVQAFELGFDCIGTTLNGYTDYTTGAVLPDTALIKKLVETIDLPIIAEGGIWSPEQLVACFEAGAYTAVVGTAITRPMLITERFVQAIKKS